MDRPTTHAILRAALGPRYRVVARIGTAPAPPGLSDAQRARHADGLAAARKYAAACGVDPSTCFTCHNPQTEVFTVQAEDITMRPVAVCRACLLGGVRGAWMRIRDIDRRNEADQIRWSTPARVVAEKGRG